LLQKYLKNKKYTISSIINRLIISFNLPPDNYYCYSRSTHRFFETIFVSLIGLIIDLFVCTDVDFIDCSGKDENYHQGEFYLWLISNIVSKRYYYTFYIDDGTLLKMFGKYWKINLLCKQLNNNTKNLETIFREMQKKYNDINRSPKLGEENISNSVKRTEEDLLRIYEVMQNIIVLMDLLDIIKNDKELMRYTYDFMKKTDDTTKLIETHIDKFKPLVDIVDNNTYLNIFEKIKNQFKQVLNR